MAKFSSASQMKSSKWVSIPKLVEWTKTLRKKGKKMVFTNGCFDLLHVGHVSYLERARKLGDYLVVAVNSDASVRSLKGPHRPINNEKSRARVLAALQAVDFVVIFRTERVTPLLKQLRPEVYVKGGDYTPESLHPEERAAIRAYQGRIRILPLWKGYSTTRIIQKINL